MASFYSNIILGIDPGTVIMGFGLVGIRQKKPELLGMGTLSLRKYSNAYERLRQIHEKVTALIIEYQPNDFAIEAPFYGKNVQSMLRLGRAQGVAIAAAMQAGIPVCEYSPKKIKLSVTGNGNASKEQIWQMLEYTLHFSEKPHYFDATDAVAVALCHHYQQNTLVSTMGREVKDWKDFIEKYPNKVLKR